MSFTPQGFIFINCIILLLTLLFFYYFGSRSVLNYFFNRNDHLTKCEIEKGKLKPCVISRPGLLHNLFFFQFFFSNTTSMSHLKICKLQAERKSTMNLILKNSSYVCIDIKLFDFGVPVKSEITLSFFLHFSDEPVVFYKLFTFRRSH